MSAEFYTSAHQITPLMPGEAKAAHLLEKASEVAARAASLTRHCGLPTILGLQGLVRSMNSYYSNTIEGQGTHPAFIEAALHRDFSDRPDIARRQRLAVAHIEAEQAFESWLQEGHVALSSEAAIKAHDLLYSRLGPGDRATRDGILVEPGALRMQNVMVGRHRPPAHGAINTFFSAFDNTFAHPPSSPSRQLMLAACAHQKMAWIHPFADGNGRMARLQTHGALFGVTAGLWSVNRGFARDREGYYAHIAAADQPRRGDLDGRGNLTEAGLVAWIGYFLDICLDQVDFVSDLLGLEHMRRNIEAWVAFEGQSTPYIRRELVLPLHHLFLVGELTRAEFSQMTGLGQRNARYAISALLSQGVLNSPSRLGPLRFGFPLPALRFLLPELYPEAGKRLPG